MNSCTHTSSLTTKCLSAPSDQLLAPRRPLNTAAVRGRECREGRCSSNSEDSVSIWERSYDLGDAPLDPTHTQELMECLKVIKVWLLDAAESVTFPVTTLLVDLLFLVQYQKGILSRMFLFFCTSQKYCHTVQVPQTGSKSINHGRFSPLLSLSYFPSCSSSLPQHQSRNVSHFPLLV